MSFAAGLKWINQHVASIVVLLMLLGVGIVAHGMAVNRVEMADGQLPLKDSAHKSRIQLILYIDERPVAAVSYAIVFLACLAWLEFRKTSRWTSRLAFGLLAVPALGYMWVCMRVGSS